MKKLGKSTVNILLSVVLVAGLLPVNAQAADAEQITSNESTSNTISAESLTTMDEGTLTEGWTKCGTCEWQISSTGVLTVRPLGDGASGTLAEWSSSPWAGNTSIKTAVFDMGVTITSCFEMFKNCTNLQAVSFGYAKTSSVKLMQGMFAGCSSLVMLDLHGFEGEAVTDTESMFQGCSSLVYLNMGYFDSSNVTYQGLMFEGCSSLKMIRLKPGTAFYGTDIREASWTDSSGTYSTSFGMFSHNAEQSGDDPIVYIDASLTVDSGWTQCGTCQWLLDSDGLLTIKPMNGTSCGILDQFTRASSGAAPWNDDKSKILSVKVEQGVVANAQCAKMFEDCSKATSIDLSQMNTSNTTDMGYLFDGCSALTELKLPTSAVSLSCVDDLDFAFDGCSKLTELDLSAYSFQSGVSLSSIFSGSSGLTTVKLPDCQPGQVTSAFDGCSSLVSVDVSGMDFSHTSSVSMANMFSGCSSLTELDLSTWDFSPVWYMQGMFYNCKSLTSVTFPSDTTLTQSVKLSTVSGIFQNCTSLTTVTGFFNLDFSKLTNAKNMFNGCSSLVTLDLSDLTVTSTLDITNMLSGCSSLKYLTLPAATDFSLAGLREVAWTDADGDAYDTTADMLADNLSRTADAKEYKALSATSGWNMYGTCEWMVDDDGSLTIRPLAEYETGTLPAWEDTPAWHESTTPIVSVTIEEPVIAKTCKNMFWECPLVSADLSNLIISSETNLTDMFLECDALTTLTLPAGMDLTQAGLAEYIESLWADTSNYVYATTDSMFAANAARTSGTETYKAVALTDDTWTRCGACEWKIDETGLMTVQPITGLDTDLPAKLEDWGETSPWMNNNTILIAKFEKGVAAQTCSHMFAGCKGLTFNDGTTRLSYIQNLDTSEVTDMTSMFEGCTSLAAFEMLYLDISQVTTMNSMFKGCTSLSVIRFSAKVQLAVADIENMFAGCSSLGSVDLSSFDFSAISALTGMFSGCSTLYRMTLPAGADLSSAGVREAGWKVRNVDTAYVTTAEMLAANQARTADAVEYDVLEATEGWKACGTAEWRITDDGELEIRPMDSLSVGILAEWTTAPWAAYYEEIEGFSVAANTVMARTCANMFKDCAYLVAADFTRFDTSQATSLQNMFKGCTHLTTLLLSGFNTANVTNMSGMFAGCKRLTSITVSDEFVTTNVTDSENMFMGCSNLKGQNGTPYGSSHVDKTYARIDTADAKGYFTSEYHYLSKTEEVPATYEAAGTKAYWTCSSCGKFYSDENALNRITDLDAWKAEGGEGYLAPLTPITVENMTAQVDDAFASMSTTAGITGLYKITAQVNGLVEGYVPMVGATAMVKDGDTYVALVDQSTAEAVSQGTLSISPAKGTVESVSEIQGDINMSGTLNIVDAQIAYDLACGHYALGGALTMAQVLSADMAADGALTASDAFAIQSAIFQ